MAVRICVRLLSRRSTAAEPPDVSCELPVSSHLAWIITCGAASHL